MGVINLTPDSFSNDGLLRFKEKTFVHQAIHLAESMVCDGADILDVGAESSRPDAKPISSQEEIKRLKPVLKALVKKFKIPISVDTYKEPVAQMALDEGVSMINTIKGTQLERSFAQMVGRYKAAIVLMHMRGDPQTMQKNIRYKNLIREIIFSLRRSIEICLESTIKSDRIIIDPGIGFSKTPEQNLEILGRLSAFDVLRKPILVGTSRKSFIGKITGKDVDARLSGTLASVCVSVINGAHIVRVHDVAQVRDAVQVIDAILNRKII